MSVEATTGVTALARILNRLGQGGGLTVDQLAVEQGIARTTAFDIVRRLHEAHLVRRNIDGTVALGPAAIAFGYAAHGIAALHGPAAALVDWLHDGTGASVDLVAHGQQLLHRGKPLVEPQLEAALCDPAGAERARLRLEWCPTTNRAERQAIAARFERAHQSLQYYLAAQGDVP